MRLMSLKKYADNPGACAMLLFALMFFLFSMPTLAAVFTAVGVIALFV